MPMLCRPSYGGRGLKLESIMRLRHWQSRPSYGGRGLKHRHYNGYNFVTKSPLVWGAWIETIRRLTNHLAYVVAPRMGGVD